MMMYSISHLDRIANQGVRFTSGYASAYVCAPSRAGLLTGRYQQRFGFYSGGDSRIGLPLTEITIASHLKKHGYTTGVFGKWHLGLEKDYHPLNRGFDEFYGFLGHGAHDYFELKADDEHNGMWRNWDRIDDQGYLTDNLGKEAASFIARRRCSARPPIFDLTSFHFLTGACLARVPNSRETEARHSASGVPGRFSPRGASGG